MRRFRRGGWGSGRRSKRDGKMRRDRLERVIRMDIFLIFSIFYVFAKSSRVGDKAILRRTGKQGKIVIHTLSFFMQFLQFMISSQTRKPIVLLLFIVFRRVLDGYRGIYAERTELSIIF